MAANLDKAFIVGNLCADPATRYTQGKGDAVCNLRVATNRKYKGSDGEWKEETTFFGIEVWGKQAEACEEYLKKGAPVLIEGRHKLNEWEKEFILQDGTTHKEKHSTLIVVAERVQFLQGRAKAETSGDIPF